MKTYEEYLTMIDRANELCAAGGRYGLTKQEQKELNRLVRETDRLKFKFPATRVQDKG